MKILLPILLFLAIVSSGCYSIETVESTKISSADVYQSYDIKTDKDRTSVSATFRVGSKSGATIDLDAPSKIEYNGKPMTEIAPTGWKGTTYEESIKKFIGQHQFIYADGSSKSFQNRIDFAPVEFGETSVKVSRSARTLIPLSRTVGKDETISAYISGKTKSAKNKANEDSSDSVTVNLDSSRSAIVVEPNDLRNFTGGRIDLSLTVEKNESLKQVGAKGGEVQISYEAQGISLAVVK